jgi:hypothetical protein
MYYYSNKMTTLVAQLGSNPFTAIGMSEYLQNLQYMQGMMGLASIITVPLVVSVVFKGETMAALGAMNSVMGKYLGDKGGASAKDSLASQSAKHQFEANDQEAYARGELQKYGIEAPRTASAVQTLDNILSEGEKYGQAGGALRAGSQMYGGDMSAFANAKVTAGSGHGMQSTAMDVGSGVALTGAINTDPGALNDFAYQSGTDAVGSFAATAAKGRTSLEHPEYGRDAQVNAAKTMANDSLVKSVETAKGLQDSMAYNADGTIRDGNEFDKYALGTKVGSRMQANKAMGVGLWAQGKSEATMENEMMDIQRGSEMGVASEVAKGRGFKNGKYKGNIDAFERDSKDIEKSKSDSMHGQARGVRANYDKNSNIYDRNASASEKSRQQTMDEKITRQGGENASVAVDVGEASLKASSQKGALKEQQKILRDALKDGKLHGKNINDAMEDLASVNTASQFGGQVGAAGKMTKETREKMKDAMKKSGMFSKDEISQLDGLEGASLAGWIASKQAGNLSGMHGLAIGNKTVGFALGDNGNLRLTGVDSSTKNAAGTETSILATSGFTSQAIAEAKKQLGPDAEPSAINKRASEILTVANEFKSKANPLDDAAIVSAGNTVARKHGKKHSNWIPDDSIFNPLETALDKTLEFANDNASYGVAGIAANSILKNPVGKVVKGVKNKLSGKSDPESLNGTDKNGNPKNPSSEFPETHGVVDEHGNSLNKDTDSIAKDAKTVKPERNLGGGLTSNGEKAMREAQRAKYLEKMASHGKAGVALAAGAALAYEIGDYFSDGGLSDGANSAFKWMTSSHGPAGGSGNVPGSSQHKKGNLPSGEAVLDTVLNAANYLTPVASALFGTDLGGDLNMKTMGTHVGVPGSTPAWAQGIQQYTPGAGVSPVAASVLSGTQPPSGGFNAPTMVQQASDNHANTQAFAQAIAAQGASYGPSATEASTSRMADIMQDQKNNALSFNKKMEINSNAAYTKDTMNHKELLEFQRLTAGLNPDKFDGEGR